MATVGCVCVMISFEIIFLRGFNFKCSKSEIPKREFGTSGVFNSKKDHLMNLLGEVSHQFFERVQGFFWGGHEDSTTTETGLEDLQEKT